MGAPHGAPMRAYDIFMNTTINNSFYLMPSSVLTLAVTFSTEVPV